MAVVWAIGVAVILVYCPVTRTESTSDSAAPTAEGALFWAYEGNQTVSSLSRG